MRRHVKYAVVSLDWIPGKPGMMKFILFTCPINRANQ